MLPKISCFIKIIKFPNISKISKNLTIFENQSSSPKITTFARISKITYFPKIQCSKKVRFSKNFKISQNYMEMFEFPKITRFCENCKIPMRSIGL